ncbi:uncharacterized protein PGTG_02464 [Puccinia graminis f. sp. tritici CRL 75-36-700-3]|uniref:Uncharacterized protein n=1 Tax=Puccinia graminis f. sp. tritici (strain CRL 75-36-700-3 / race SCCL) TaxID=418459 RepID=E3JY78_PUCGT|nr:uncharacterized protein PGTG_02464 [Puccinia graminis f. sp. tritici CRL 75-36-700-3]EFP77003.1 hypothetical protein PGTG_02464 [Puccinia graminis f. sp. tritici CRL 75-36-700-3]
MVNIHGCEFCRDHMMESTCEVLPLTGHCKRCRDHNVQCNFQSRTVLIETLYQNIMTLRTNLALKEWSVKEWEERYNHLAEEFNKMKDLYGQIYEIAYNNSSPSE